MNDETLNLSIRKFLKMVGVKSQHEIEQAVAAALAARTVAGSEAFSATMNLKVPELGIDVLFSGTIELE
jgi:D-alanyl-D-alanine carboxypeptidase